MMAEKKLTAMYEGSCSVCGNRVEVGSDIYWDSETRDVRHVDCEPATEEQAPYDVWEQSEYGASHSVGDVIHDREQGYLVVMNVAKKWYPAEDAMTFGLYNCPDGGYSITYRCRQATDEEAEPVKQQEAAAALSKQHLQRHEEMSQMFREKGEYPESPDGEPFEVLKTGEILCDTMNIYGGGSAFVADGCYLWYVKNNGMDGDNWSRNNVRTWGAGAIGWRLPLDQALVDEVKELAGTVKAVDDDRRLMAMVADSQMGIGVE